MQRRTGKVDIDKLDRRQLGGTRPYQRLFRLGFRRYARCSTQVLVQDLIERREQVAFEMFLLEKDANYPIDEFSRVVDGRDERNREWAEGGARETLNDRTGQIADRNCERVEDFVFMPEEIILRAELGIQFDLAS